ncbi:VOC family protein [Lusitaniella coriacea]|uniref:VOC family protein n=1 Tax=Lusitaniella coriacea TaxID=1983105 RepID=UPI003CFBB68F
MNFQYVYTRLNVENFQTCKAFYRDVLNLSVKFEDERDEYVEFDAGSLRITLFNREKLTDFISRDESLTYDSHSARVVLSFQVSNVEEAVAYLQTHGVEMLNVPTNYPDRGFISTCFRDPDNNLIELEQMTDVLIS